MRAELEAVERARAGGAALDALIAEIWPEAYRLSFAILRDRGLAEDAAQEACAAIARRLSSLRESAAFAAWSYRVVTSHALDAARRRPQTASLEAAELSRGFVDDLEAIDVEMALASLEPRQRAAIILHYYAGLNSAEIAGALGVAPSTVRFHLMRARAALRRALTVTGFAPAHNEVLKDA